MNKYYILSIVIGILNKLYDDIYDNNLYKTLGISKKNKLYLNEFLKCSFALGLAVISINFPFFFVGFFVMNIITYFIKKDEYGAYELSGLIASFILIPYFNWKNDQEYITNTFLVFFSLIGGYFLDKICNLVKNTEYSNTKLVTRGIISICAFLCILIDNNILGLIVPKSVIICGYFLIGYLSTSCIFQYLLINKIIKAPIKIKKNKKNKKNKKKDF